MAGDLFRKTGLFLLLFVAVAGILAGTVYGLNKWVKCCPLFVISKIEVQGAERLDPVKIKAESGLKEGSNIFAFDSDRIAKDLMELEPWIMNVEISRKLPDTVVINIEERRPAALVRISGSIWIMDERGTPFKIAAKEDDFSGPIITGVELPNKEGKSDRAKLDPIKVKDALTIVRLSRKGARALGFFNISQIDFQGDEAVVIYTADKAVPFYLDREHLKRQFYRAEKILYQLYTSGEYAKVASVTVGYGDETALAVLKKRR